MAHQMPRRKLGSQGLEVSGFLHSGLCLSNFISQTHLVKFCNVLWSNLFLGRGWRIGLGAPSSQTARSQTRETSHVQQLYANDDICQSKPTTDSSTTPQNYKCGNRVHSTLLSSFMMKESTSVHSILATSGGNSEQKKDSSTLQYFSMSDHVVMTQGSLAGARGRASELMLLSLGLFPIEAYDDHDDVISMQSRSWFRAMGNGLVEG